MFWADFFGFASYSAKLFVFSSSHQLSEASRISDSACHSGTSITANYLTVYLMTVA